ncbi:hypothetical protein [Neobacillus niacini]|uniref:hypothetical protein n=1 Tax=Neobacillus niacini TaxID=86668 RepID=UPI0021CB576A|nr:hypothetical protein [Neobacillus niacini]MCM3768758.1 hypothetical protein [Neobacillus niacini]
MEAKVLWSNLLKQAQEAEFEIHTIPQNQRTRLWFQVEVQGNYLVISKAKRNSPSARLSMERKISYKDFEFVFRYYERWLKGEPGVRQEVAQKSQNTAYIFALISAGAKQVRI